jgi:hypothetical protein
LSSTISRPNSNACLHWNSVMRLVDLDMAIARADLPLVWDLHIFTRIVAALSMCLKVQKCSQSPENTCVATTHTSATQDTHCTHMSYFVRRHCPYLVHFVRLKIERTNLWDLCYTITMKYTSFVYIKAKHDKRPI